MTKEYTKEQLLKMLSEKDVDLEKRDAKIAKLEDMIAWLKRKVFGKMTEKFIPEDPNKRQLELFGDELSLEEKEALEKQAKEEDILLTKTIKVHKKRTPRKDPSWDNLREEEVILEPKEKDDDRYVYIDSEESKKLAFIPGELYVKKIIRKKYALKEEIQGTEETEFLPSVTIAPLPHYAIAKCLADSSLLSEIILNKYLYHIPFHRQIQKFKNLGARLNASTVGEWFAASTEVLKPIYDNLKAKVMATDYIQVDESTIQVIDDGKNKTRKGYIWVVRDPISGNVFFHYDHGSRSYKTARTLLFDFKGAIQSDGYQAYHQFESLDQKLMLGCWAHARRKFERALDENKELATQALLQIQELYKIEREADDNHLDYSQRKELRTKKAYPILCRFEKWLMDNYSKVLQKSRTGKAIAYTYSLFPKLSRYHLDGRYRIDNNLVENSVRSLAIGRLCCAQHNLPYVGNKIMLA